MKLTAAAASVAVLGLLLAGCGGSGSSNTADYRACKAGIKAELTKSASSGAGATGPPQTMSAAGAAACDRLSHADMTRLMHEVNSELNSRPSTVHLPAQLFGLKKNTSALARSGIRGSTGPFAADRQDFRQPPWGAVYGSHSGPAILVVGAMFTVPVGLTAQSFPGFDKQLAAHATKTWPKTLRVFPAGAHGGALYCARISGRPETDCLWADKVGAGQVSYFRGSASSLSDAAAKTNQIRAMIEPSSPPTAPGGPQLPARLFGVNMSTGPAVRANIRTLLAGLASQRSLFRSPQAAIYGSAGNGLSHRPGIVLYDAKWSSVAALSANSAAFDGRIAAYFVKTTGITTFRAFPAGPHGGVLYCGRGIQSGVPGIACGWADKVTVGTVLYFGRVASSLGDAASKTNQVRAMIEPTR